MRIRTWKTVSFFMIGTNLLALIYMLTRLDSNKCRCSQDEINRSMRKVHRRDIEDMFDRPFHVKDADSPEEKPFLEKLSYLKSDNVSQSVYDKFTSLVEKLVTVVIREFEEFENDVDSTINSLLDVYPNISILIISDHQPYPPLKLKASSRKNLRIISLKQEPLTSSTARRPENFITTKYLLSLPDSMRVSSSEQIHKMIVKIEESRDMLIAAKVVGGKPRYFNINLDIKRWSLMYKPIKTLADTCDIIHGSHVVLIPTKWLLMTSLPWARPFPFAALLQMNLWKRKVHVLKEVVFQAGEALHMDAHNLWKHNHLVKSREEQFFQVFGIKKVTLVNGDIEWYGCTKTSPRCFPTVHDDTPDYLYRGRWTPPCCLEHLRETARHVFQILNKCGVRYWLEGGSLLGAVRHENIIPWDYDIDIGIYKEDIVKCNWLKNAMDGSIVDSEMFVWEKATEGDFMRVQYSKTNHLHVDIFPFYLKNDVMTKDSWFPTHRQDTEFPEHYLKPLSKIKFIGMYVSAPNNIRDFLELKFGKGVIEKPEYPMPSLLKYQSNTSTL